jgi:hypothetical protein
MQTYWGTGDIVPRILNFGTLWRLLNNFTIRSLYYRGKSPEYPVDRRLGTLRPGLDAVGKRQSLYPAGNRTPIARPFSQKSAAVTAELPVRIQIKIHGYIKPNTVV